MKIVPMYFARLPDPLRPGRFYRTRHRMRRADIQRRGGIVLEDTVELREIAETDDEMAARLPTRTPAGGWPGERAASDARPAAPPVDDEAIWLAQYMDAALFAFPHMTAAEAMRWAVEAFAVRDAPAPL